MKAIQASYNVTTPSSFSFIGNIN